ncbi:MAG: TraR/DksA family transcriptional regulator [Actinomycetota bacterium]
MSPVETHSPALDTEEGSAAGHLRSETLALIKHSLEQKNKELQRQLESSSLQDPDYLPFASGDLGASDDPAELVFGLFEWERNQSIVETLRKLLRQNQDALDRLAAGSYGECARCAQTIAPERLKAIPSAEMCVRCQQTQDRANEFRVSTAPKPKVKLWG